MKKRYLPIVLVISFALLLMMLYFYMNSHLDFSSDELMFRNAKVSSVISIYTDESGNHASSLEGYRAVLKEEVCLNDIKNEWADLSEIPEQLIDAFLCTEDREFYEHHGVNLPRTLYAMLNAVFKGKKRFGASTITQQLIKNISGDNEISIRRKFDEILRAYHLESTHNKDEILQMYFNIIPMGDNVVGVKEAASHYFDKELSELTVAECATLVGLTNAPSRYHPVRHVNEALAKRNTVLESMLKCGKLTQEQFEQAREEPLQTSLQDTSQSNVMSWFAEGLLDEIKEDLIKHKNMSEQSVLMLMRSGGLRIYSTQESAATQALNKVFLNDDILKRIEQDQMNYAMVIINNQTGNLCGVLGATGKKDANRLLNLATQAPHTPGSTLKPIALYAPLIEARRINWASVFDDIPLSFYEENNLYRAYPQNLPKRYDGLTTVKRALMLSKNTVAMRLYNMLGAEKIYHILTEDYGFSHIVRKQTMYNGNILTDLAPAPLALGQLTYGVTVQELAEAFSTFARDGVKKKAKGYLAVYDGEGKLLLENKEHDTRIYKKETARIMNQLLSCVVQEGTAKSIKLWQQIDLAGKTGTSGDDKDRFFVGYTPYYTAAIWCAKKDSISEIGKPSLSHLSLWEEVMRSLHHEQLQDSGRVKSFSIGGLVRGSYCLDSGQIPSPLCSLDLRGERIAVGYFTPDNIPRTVCTRHIAVAYDTLCDAVAHEGCFGESEIRIVAMLDMPNRSFPCEIVVSDAEYMVYGDIDACKAPFSYDQPYFLSELCEGTFVGRGKNKKQKNSGCYYHNRK